jgi:tight adherence protein B
MSLSFLVGVVAGDLLGGPVAAFALGLYATVGVLFLRRRHTAKAHRDARSSLLDRLTGLAADLRAGIPMPSATETAFADPVSTGAGPGLVALARAAATLAERTGAPLAELIDRIEADARAGDRARAAAAAQAAGAQATGLMLAGLPVAGLGLGFAIGTDPLAILLHTPLGAACALAAVALQITGLIWSQHLQPRQP